MTGVFARRRERLLAMKAMRENYVPGDRLVKCPKCGEPVLSHRACKACGYYAGRQVIKVAEEN